MKSTLSFIAALLILFQNCSAQQKVKDISLKDLNFSSIFGYAKRDSLHTYCLLGTGYFRAPSADNSDSLIAEWLTLHPDAKVVSIVTSGPIMKDKHDRRMTYCWLIDGTDTINNYLIKNGCFPGGTMMKPEPLEDESSNMIIHIDEHVYHNFIEQVKAAEIFAEKNQLGIWKKKIEE